ncbi:hypothetical protein ZIOFF_016295 [Zingiber officinale]|uniref:Uncharacterized protein n=1 Tax=Zingiber officinale TaxID=94328 RepID=A0A8J5I2I4_ZINOF|nr:hypothetical protein ZIOFF_016295 [Zingiber officinale]
MSFYRKACGIPFERLRCMRPCSFVKSVAEWDDSAAVEALRDAKARYFDQYHGRRSAVPPPDPDAYIDEIDHDAPVELDPELIEELERTPSECDDDGAAAGADPFAELRFEDMEIVPTGWDVETEPDDPLASLMRPRN